MFIVVYGVAPLAWAQDSSNCTIVDLSIGRSIYEGPITERIAVHVQSAIENPDPAVAFPVLSPVECWSACLYRSTDCVSWAVFELPLVVNDTPWIQCAHYSDSSISDLLEDDGISQGDLTDIPESLFAIPGMRVEYGETSSAFGLELDCKDDVSDSQCLGTNEEICSLSVPFSPLTFDDTCRDDTASNDVAASCVVGCCRLRTLTLDGIMPSTIGFSDLYPTGECFEQIMMSEVMYPEQCVDQCKRSGECSFSIFETIRGAQSIGPPLLSTCRLVQCTVDTVDIQRISESFLSPLGASMPQVGRHWNVYVPGLTADEAVQGSYGRIRPDQITTTTTTTIPPTTTTTTTILVTTAMPCIAEDYDNSAPDLMNEWAVFSAEKCQTICQENALCGSWVWVRDDTGCYLKVGEGTLFRSKAIGPKVFGGLAFCDGDDVSSFERPILQGVLINEEPINEQTFDLSVGVWLPHFTDCGDLCELHPLCQTWTFIASNNQCYLKVFHTNVTTVAEIETHLVDGIFSGGFDVNAPFLSDDLLSKKIPTDCFEPGVNYNGFDLTSFWTATPIDCSHQCNNDTQCLYFTYNPENNMCFLKFSNDGRAFTPIAKQGKLISGSRDCPEVVKVPILCGTNVLRPEPHPSCDVYTQYFSPDTSTWVDLALGSTQNVSNFNQWWKKEQVPLDLTNTRVWSRSGFAFVVPSTDPTLGPLCNLSDYTPKDESCWARAPDYFPFAMEVEVVAVAPQAVFSGFGVPTQNRPGTEWTILDKRVIDMTNLFVHHGFHFDYEKPDHWPVNLLAPVDFEFAQVHFRVKIRDIKFDSPVRPSEIYVIFCIWGELQPELMVDQPDKHSESCAPPLVLVPTDPSLTEYVLGTHLSEAASAVGMNEVYGHRDT
eukprot:GHVH01017444.1.p1 GENE.GHVH01017444.1~~GHVH01017444.1.p1  ORF type:complete len:885 (-),score=98.48 GHVH01017444.1:626-3280(-)